MKKKMSVAFGRINLFLHPALKAVYNWNVSSTQHRALLFLLLLHVGNIRLNWMFCLGSSHSRILNVICILISQMKLQLMKRIDTDGGGFEGSPRLESRHGGFALRTVSPCYYLTRPGYLLPYTEIPQVLMNPLLKSGCTGKFLCTAPHNYVRILYDCDRLSVGAICLNRKISQPREKKRIWQDRKSVV